MCLDLKAVAKHDMFGGMMIKAKPVLDLQPGEKSYLGFHLSNKGGGQLLELPEPREAGSRASWWSRTVKT